MKGGSNVCVFQMKASQQNFPVVLFIMLYKIICNFQVWVESPVYESNSTVYSPVVQPVYAVLNEGLTF